MLATKHDQFSPRLRNRLKTTGMGLGLVRLLLDARLAEEARTTLLSLQTGFQVPEVRVYPGSQLLHKLIAADEVTSSRPPGGLRPCASRIRPT